MNSGLARIVFLLALSLVWGAGAAAAAECSGNPQALGTSRTIVVDPREHSRIGTMDYAETLPLVDKEVVLTFDDGPIPPYTTRILDILASECIRATYFIVGSMAKEYPALVKRAYDEGHTIGTHSMTHPLKFRALSVDRANAQIDDGIAATVAALGDPDKLAPFFRFPGFGHTPAAEQHTAEHGIMVWGADFPADDWKSIGAKEVARRAIQRLEAKGRGILLLHDIHQRTVEALPIIIAELKARSYRIVHVVPATEELRPTVTAASDWRLGPRTRPSAPVILMASLQDLGAEMLAKKTADQLCTLSAATRETTGSAIGHRHGRAALAARSEKAHNKVDQAGVSPVKLPSHRAPHGKASRAKMAHAEPAAFQARDIHSVQ